MNYWHLQIIMEALEEQMEHRRQIMEEYKPERDKMQDLRDKGEVTEESNDYKFFVERYQNARNRYLETKDTKEELESSIIEIH